MAKVVHFGDSYCAVKDFVKLSLILELGELCLDWFKLDGNVFRGLDIDS